MVKPESVVVYAGLPLSAGSSHGLGRVSSRAAFEAWTAFLDACTAHVSRTHFFTFPETPGRDG